MSRRAMYLRWWWKRRRKARLLKGRPPILVPDQDETTPENP